jgi:hypothetical protein
MYQGLYGVLHIEAVTSKGAQCVGYHFDVGTGNSRFTTCLLVEPGTLQELCRIESELAKALDVTRKAIAECPLPAEASHV